MRALKAVLALLLALSVAMLPVAASVTPAIAANASIIAVDSDCCPKGQPCDKGMPDDCGKMAACTLKCFNLSATIAVRAGAAPSLATTQLPLLMTERVKSSAEIPPAPPPRA